MTTLYATQKAVKASLKAIGIKRVGSDAARLLADQLNDEINRSQIASSDDLAERITLIGNKLKLIAAQNERDTVTSKDIALAFEV